MPLTIAWDRTAVAPKVRLDYERLAVLSDIEFSWQSSTDLSTWTQAQPVSSQSQVDIVLK
jgi:hypothetical protein